MNIKKHGICFEHAAHVFTDPLRKEDYDVRHSNHEENRTFAIGVAEGRLLFVNFTEPDTETIRIISARKANKYERRYYYGNRETYP
ncbi:MAG: BrnT family toxin [Treponema sp.]|nr:BrnT family toxin [Treponema sp.]